MGSKVTRFIPNDGQAQNARGWGCRFLKNTKVVDGILYRLHATRGWKKIGKAEAQK